MDFPGVVLSLPTIIMPGQDYLGIDTLFQVIRRSLCKQYLSIPVLYIVGIYGVQKGLLFFGQVADLRTITVLSFILSQVILVFAKLYTYL